MKLDKLMQFKVRYSDESEMEVNEIIIDMSDRIDKICVIKMFME